MNGATSGTRQGFPGATLPVRQDAGVEITLACGDYDRTKALQDGTVLLEGFNIRYMAQPPERTFSQLLDGADFDIAEMSLATYLAMSSRGPLDHVALPVFPSRMFRHSAVFVRKDGGITTPSDLRGKRVGVPFYQMTAAVWVRAFLQHDYGVMPGDLEWVVGRGAQAAGEVPKDPGLQLRQLVSEEGGPGSYLANELERGGIDALVTTYLPPLMLSGRSQARRLFERPRDVESDYYRRTGIFPIMHTVVVKQSLLAHHPHLGQILVDAFEKAKHFAWARLFDINALSYMLPFLTYNAQDASDVFGHDYWPYGIARNRATLEALSGYLVEQEIVGTKPDLAKCFLDIEPQLAEPA